MDPVSGSPQAALPPAVLSVSEISGIISEALEDERLQNVWIRGEITTYKHHHSGHRYFDLSEQVAGKNFSLKCVMWKSRAETLGFIPQKGLAVIAFGYVQFYGGQGQVQFYVQEMREAGEGEKHLLLERWKRELAAEGFFAEERKKPLPQFPCLVGVVTARTGAVLQDIQNVIGRRYPVEILLSPTAVQGENAHRDIARAIRLLDGRVDVIIVARGGGSFDDLFPFNHPDVVRTIGSCRTPVVSAVGHEVDHVLADLAADRRAPTPSAAAELVVPDRADLCREIADLRARSVNSLEKKVRESGALIEDMRMRLHPKRIARRLNEIREEVTELGEGLDRGVLALIERHRGALGREKAILESRSPLSILSHGYCIAEKDHQVIRSARELHPGDRVRIRMADGSAKTTVEEVKYDQEV